MSWLKQLGVIVIAGIYGVFDFFNSLDEIFAKKDEGN